MTGRVLPTEELELCNRRVLGLGMQSTVDFCGSLADRDVCALGCCECASDTGNYGIRGERGEAHGGMTANIPTLSTHIRTFFEAAYNKFKLHSPTPHSCAGTEGSQECGD